MPWPCCCGGEDVNCNNFKNENCCINPYDNYEYVILICNSNAAKDDEFNVVLNDTLLGPITELGLNQCGGRFFATSESAISKVKSLASTCNNSFNDCCMQNTFNFTLFSKDLIQIGSNKISMYNTKNNFNGNQGRIIVFRVMNDKKVTAVHNGQYGGPSGADIINAAIFDQLNCDPIILNNQAGTQLYPNPLGYYGLSPIRSIIEPIGEMIDLALLPNILYPSGGLINPFTSTNLLRYNAFNYGSFGWRPFFTSFHPFHDFDNYFPDYNSVEVAITSTTMFNLLDINRNTLILSVYANYTKNGITNIFWTGRDNSITYTDREPIQAADLLVVYDNENNITITLTSNLSLFYTYRDTTFFNQLSYKIGTIKVTNIYRGTPLSC